MHKTLNSFIYCINAKFQVIPVNTKIYWSVRKFEKLSKYSKKFEKKN
jgi:hypothetical protein